MSTNNVDGRTAFELVIARIDRKIDKLLSARRRLEDQLAGIKAQERIANADIVDSDIEEILDEPTNDIVMPVDEPTIVIKLGG